ncbi:MULTISPECIES: allophanate hydrolase-related protein [Nocardia]|uniref:Gamma-glutamylcyclotransferase n=1 Tax=Nocardia salmonicida TaxID=53431 RepID=A0ABZ1NF13_9NOCA|nr:MULTISPECIES: gamma-glutamylcyclotransferase [Nocardia]
MSDDTVRMFVNGQAMRGGQLHDALASARFVGRVRTAPVYRFFDFDDVFPGLAPVSEGGWCVPGEIYEVSYRELRDQLLPREPAELELSVIELEDGRGSLSMVCRRLPAGDDSVREITAAGGWHEHRAASADRL